LQKDVQENVDVVNKDFFDRTGALDPLAPGPPGKVVKLGVERLNRLKLNLRTEISQYWGIIKPGLITAEHIFQGLERGLYYKGNMEADQDVFIYTWKPPLDFVWQGNRISGKPVGRDPSKDKVFAVLVCLYDSPVDTELFGQIRGSIEHWSWLKESDQLPSAPFNWEKRYGRKVWSKEQ